LTPISWPAQAGATWPTSAGSSRTAPFQNQTHLVNQLTACLKAYYPAALELFRQPRQPSSLAFLESYPTPEAALEADIEEIAALLKRHGHPRPNQTAEHIMRKVREPHLKADAITTRTKARLMLALVSIWVRVVHAMWPRHEPYDASTRLNRRTPARLLEALFKVLICLLT